MNRPTDSRRLSNFQIGLIAIVITVIGFYLAFSKSIPFTGNGYEIKAVFQDSQNLRVKSPVRIAGVDVGEVTKVEHLTDENGNGQDAAVVTMAIDDEGRPIADDATFAIRPRLFLEGNLFVDVNPGTPGALADDSSELESGDVVPLEQTSISVQFDQVLTSLQAPVRGNLQIFLKEFGDALDKYGGGEGFQESFRTSPAAYGATAQVNEAFLGREPGDLAGFIRNLDTVVDAFNQRQVQLQDLITNFRIVTGGFAAESDSLEQAIIELPQLLAEGTPALAKLNRDFPALRAFAREALPGTKAANVALDDASPWIGQMRQLVSKPELRGLVKDLRPTVPDLARLARASVPFLEESRLLASCFNQIVIPWGDTPIPSTDGDPNDPVYKQTAFGLVGVSGESRSGDGNGQEFKVIAGGGANTVSFGATPGLVGNNVGVLPYPILGAEPAKQSSGKTPFRPDVPCETQEPPNLNAGATGPPGNPLPTTARSSGNAAFATPEVSALSNEFARIYMDQLHAEQLLTSGKSAEGRQLQKQADQAMADYYKNKWDDYQQAIRAMTGSGG